MSEVLKVDKSLFAKELSLCDKPKFSMCLQPDGVNLWYFKL